jgi:polyprenyl-phospho-N-acetylgalactosaminyl synthase
MPVNSNPLLNSTWIVIPAWNESTRLPEVLRGLRDVRCEIVVVDDGSADTTAEVGKQAGVWVLRHLVNRGQGAALRTGIDFALKQGAQTIVTFDADGQHRAADLPVLLQPIEDNTADLVLGSRFLGSCPGIPALRRLLLKSAVLFTRITTGLKLTDAHNGLRAMSRLAAERIRFSEDGMAHASQIISLAARENLRIKEIPCTITYSSQTLAKGQSNKAALSILGRLVISRLTR